MSSVLSVLNARILRWPSRLYPIRCGRPTHGRANRVRRLVVGLGLVVAQLTTMVAGVTTGRADECVAIDDFSTSKVGEFPVGWKVRKEEGRGVYTVQEEEGRRFLHASSKDLGIQAARQYEWDLNRYPVLAWSWRPVEFPRGSDERNSKTNDSALAVYAVFPHTKFSLKSVKYIWSASVPVGERLTSNMGLTQVRVLKSGTEGKGRWVEESVNVLEDYKKLFDAKETPKPGGIAVLTDADDTHSQAQGDYANFRVCAP